MGTHVIVWVLMTGAYDNYGLDSIYAEPLDAFNSIEGEWQEHSESDGTSCWWTNETGEGFAEIFTCEVS